MALLRKSIAQLSLVLAVLVPSSNVAGETFSKKIAVESSKSGVALGAATITVQQAGDSTVVKLEAPTTMTANAFYLDTPARLVIDAAGCKTRRSEKFPGAPRSMVSAVRVGAHADKLRVVVDLSVDSKPAFTLAAGERSVTLTIRGAGTGSREEIVLPTVKPTVQATATTVKPVLTLPKVPPTEVSRPAQVAQPTVVQSIVAAAPSPLGEGRGVVAEVPTTVPTPVPQASSGTAAVGEVPASGSPTSVPQVMNPAEPPAVVPTATQVLPTVVPSQVVAAPTLRGTILYLLNGYRFEYLEPGRSPVLKIILNKARANAQISKVGSRAYKIVISSCGISGRGLDLPQFPPADFIGFVMVAAKLVEDKTEITISVEQGVTLGTFVRQNEIWVKRL
jgi:hypothetical protein